MGWTPTFAAVYPSVATVPDEDRNLLWLAFTDPYLHELQDDWRGDCARQLAEFRAEAGPRLDEPPFARLVERLLEASDRFRAVWATHDVGRFTSGQRVFHHPVVGDLHFDLHRVTLSGDPRLHMVVYTPVPGTETAARLRRLVGGEGLPEAG